MSHDESKSAGAPSGLAAVLYLLKAKEIVNI